MKHPAKIAAFSLSIALVACAIFSATSYKDAFADSDSIEIEVLRLPEIPKKIQPVATPAPAEPAPSKVSATIAAVGDLMCHESNYDAAYNSDAGSYDFRPFFLNVREFISRADLAIGNLETTFSGSDKGFRGYPRFNTPDEYLDALIDAGFDVLTNANNHVLDYGLEGLRSTSRVLDERGMPHTGSDGALPVISDVKGIKVGFVAYSYGSNIKMEDPDSMNMLYKDGKLDADSIKADIDLARSLGAELVFFCAHWGNEYSTSPSEVMRSDARQIAELGADAIIGHHPHVVQPIETIDCGGKEVPVLYSLGNFFCNPSSEKLTAEGMIAYFTIEKAGGEQPVITAVDYMPTYTLRASGDDTSYSILPVGYVLENGVDYELINENVVNQLTLTWSNTTRIAGDTFARPISDFPQSA